MPPGGARQLVSQAEYARHRGVSRQYISRLAKAGVLVMRGGKVDVAASDAVLDDRPEKVSEAATSAPVETGGQTTTYAQAKLADMLFRARLRKLEYETRSAKLIPTDEVKAVWFKQARQIRDKLLALPAKLAPQLAAVSELRAVRELLDTEIEGILKGLQDDIRYRRP
jgi:phage terminase Nu1 subunit (DNA packaging protein)